MSPGKANPKEELAAGKECGKHSVSGGVCTQRFNEELATMVSDGSVHWGLARSWREPGEDQAAVDSSPRTWGPRYQTSAFPDCLAQTAGGKIPQEEKQRNVALGRRAVDILGRRVVGSS